jgi:acetylornithine aminotransferase
MLGIELATPPQKFVDKALARGLIVNLTAQKVVRLAPAINIPRADFNAGLDILIELIASLD